MRAVQFSGYGGPAVLKIVEVDEPQAGPGEIGAGVDGVSVGDAVFGRGANTYAEHAVVSIADFSAGEHGAKVSGGGGNRRAALAEAARLFATGQLRIPVANTFALDDAAQAQAASETGHVAGRTVIVID